MGKEIKISFKLKNTITTLRPLELLHMELFSPTKQQALVEIGTHPL